jgi:hypothetical protein
VRRLERRQIAMTAGSGQRRGPRQPRHTLLADRHAFRLQFGMDARRAAGFAGAGMGYPDLQRQIASAVARAEAGRATRALRFGDLPLSSI